MNDHGQIGADAAARSADGLECPDYLEGDHVRWTLAQLQQSIDVGRPVRLNADKISRVSTLALQVLAAAQLTAGRHGISFSITSPSPAFERACADTGFNALLNSGG